MKSKDKRELVISIGFVVEIFLFMLAGFFAAYFSWLAVPSFILGIIVAISVGNKIGRNAVKIYLDKTTLEIPINQNDKQKKDGRTRRQRQRDRRK